jgi:hypothetical protein
MVDVRQTSYETKTKQKQPSSAGPLRKRVSAAVRLSQTRVVTRRPNPHRHASADGRFVPTQSRHTSPLNDYTIASTVDYFRPDCGRTLYVGWRFVCAL